MTYLHIPVSTFCLEPIKLLKKRHCEHHRQKKHCKECGGSCICEHGKLKHRCKKCGGSSICEHSKRKENCKKCKGSAYCEHNRLK